MKLNTAESPENPFIDTHIKISIINLRDKTKNKYVSIGETNINDTIISISKSNKKTINRNYNLRCSLYYKVIERSAQEIYEGKPISYELIPLDAFLNLQNKQDFFDVKVDLLSTNNIISSVIYHDCTVKNINGFEYWNTFQNKFGFDIGNILDFNVNFDCERITLNKGDEFLMDIR